MSTFSGLGSALSSLIAQRQALEVSGQNIANANTVGYTRQRAAIAAMPAASVSAMFSTSNGVGNGTQVTGIERLGDVFLDLRVRSESSGASNLAARADALKTLEKSIGEPSTTGLSDQLTKLWSAFQDLSNTPDKASARAVLLENAKAVVDRVATLASSVDTQWTQARATTVALVDQVNTTAANVADLNGRILSITNSGGSANELMDQREQLVLSLSSLVGATSRTRQDGTVDVVVAGNSLVNGTDTRQLQVTGPQVFEQAADGSAVGVVWADRPGTIVGLEGGRVAGLVSVLAPPASGGVLTGAAASYDALVVTIADQVNDLHRQGLTVPAPPATVGDAGGDFFTYDPTRPSLSFAVAITDPADIAVGGAGKGALDGSIGAQLAQLGKSKNGPDAQWSATVVELGVRTASATSRAQVAEASRASAAAQQLAQASVDTDEETVNMLAYQRAYEGAARVMTAIDEMLDTLINRTGVVGR